MGKLIVTTGNYAKYGYLLKNSKQYIYSIEELCYCIMRNPELCEDYLYDEGLARYIRESLGLKERGTLLADLIERDAPLKDLITVCFCSCDYFTRDEIEEFLQEQSKVERNEEWVRTKSKADSYLIHGNYRDAIMNYRLLLKEKEAFGITSETLGDIYHNLAIALLHTDGFTEAADFFREAYERNNREESLKQYLLALRFAGDTVMYESALDIYQVSEGITKWLDVAYFQTELETQEISDFNDLNNICHLLEKGKMNEFYSNVKRMTEQMKEQYRKYNE
ncbi:MAG: tetratricopeptide repeat protein [Lachnospiraceae bacterium]|nr:tetratricopeptide repeat protein [Lachnospiraceae bacterium]